MTEATARIVWACIRGALLTAAVACAWGAL